MVKFGYGDVKCVECNQGIGIKTNIHRNSENWENKIHSGECDLHFNFSINILTRKTFLPDNNVLKEKKVCFKGIDEIKQDLIATCKKCSEELRVSSCCRDTNTDGGECVKQCKCGNKANFKFNYKTNFIPSYKENEALYLPNLTRIQYHYKK